MGFGIGIDDLGRGRFSLVLFGSDLVDYVRLAPHLSAGLAGDFQKVGCLRGLADIADAVVRHLIAGHAAGGDDLVLLRSIGCHLAVLDRRRFDPPAD
jgi:EAL domain-containing protein (putative c-di-GMP-specific phosphodiesterase class I)